MQSSYKVDHSEENSKVQTELTMASAITQPKSLERSSISKNKFSSNRSTEVKSWDRVLKKDRVFQQELYRLRHEGKQIFQAEMVLDKNDHHLKFLRNQAFDERLSSLLFLRRC